MMSDEDFNKMIELMYEYGTNLNADGVSPTGVVFLNLSTGTKYCGLISSDQELVKSFSELMDALSLQIACSQFTNEVDIQNKITDLKG